MNKFILIMEEVSEYNITGNILSPQDAIYMAEEVFRLSKQPEEVLIMFVTSTRNDIIGAFEISRGALSQSIAEPREIFKRVILCNGSGFLLLHNHPSGDVSPSKSDVEITIRIQQGASILALNFFDHIIVGAHGSYHSIIHDIK